MAEKGLSEKPVVLKNDEFGALVFKQDDTFRVPEISWRFYLRTPAIRPNDAKKLVLADLYIKALRKKLTELTYPALLAGVGFGVYSTATGLTINVDGYSQKAKLLLEHILRVMDSFVPAQDDFEFFSELLLRAYKDHLVSSPLKQAGVALSQLLYEGPTSIQEKIDAVGGITFNDFLDFADKVVSERLIDSYCTGNMQEAEALEAWNMLNTVLPGTPCARGSISPPFPLNNDNTFLLLLLLLIIIFLCRAGKKVGCYRDQLRIACVFGAQGWGQRECCDPGGAGSG